MNTDPNQSDQLQLETRVKPGRILSLDFFRGFTMFLLVAESAHIYTLLVDPSMEGTVVQWFGEQFHHHPWNGLRFWDLIQPFFMFIVGVAIPFATRNRRKRGQSEGAIRRHAFQRAFLLLLFGWGLYCVGPGHIVFKFQNVLSQLSFTYLVAFLIMNKSARSQIIISLAFIAVAELIYRTFPLEGFNNPFTPSENFGTWLDLQYGGADLGGHWVSFNAIPTAAHTIWGVLAGQLMLSDKGQIDKLKTLLVAGVTCLVIGYALDPITPIIKRISTSSFVFSSGGWTLLTLALCYWIIDIKKWDRGVNFFAIVGMNSLFIYLFAHLGGAGFIQKFVQPFTTSLLGWMGDWTMNFITHLIVLFLLWYLCYWLYKNKLFIKI